MKSMLPDWLGQTVYIIGGGPSLRQFDFSLLQDKLTIGCNEAFRLGPEICKVCIFGDYTFWLVNEQGLRAFEGPVVTNCTRVVKNTGLVWFQRSERAKSEKETLGWYSQTGAAAVHLAVKMGASRIYLLGIDLSAEGQMRNNWHDRGPKVRPPEVFQRHKAGFVMLAKDMAGGYPECEIIQLVAAGQDGCGAFKTEPLEEHFLCEPPSKPLPESLE